MPNTAPVQVPITVDNATGAGIQSAVTSLKQFESAGTSAGESVSGSFNEAKGAAALLGEETGVKLNRHLRSVLASSGLLGPVLQAAFPVAAAIGFGEVLAKVGEEVLKFSDKELDLSRNAELVGKTIGEVDQQIIKSLQTKFELQDAYNTLVLGAKGGDAERSRLDFLKQELAILDELVVAETKRSVSAATSLTTKGFLGAALQGSALGPLGGLLLGSDAESAAAAGKKIEESLAPLVARIQELNKEIKESPWKAFKADTDDATASSKKQTEQLKKLNEQFDHILKGVSKLPIGFSQSSISRVFGSIQGSPDVSRPSGGSLADFGITSPLFPLFATKNELDIAKQYGFVMTDIITKTKQLSTAQQTLDDALTHGFENAFNDIALGTRSMGQAFESLASSVAASVLQMVAKLLILPPIISAINSLLSAIGLGGSFGSKGSVFIPGGKLSDIPLFGGGKAAGGPVMPNSLYLVGENGPEYLHTGSTSGFISPNSRGGANIQVNVINQSSQPVQASATSKFDGEKYVTSVVLKDLSNGGPIRQALVSSR